MDLFRSPQVKMLGVVVVVALGWLSGAEAQTFQHHVPLAEVKLNEAQRGAIIEATLTCGVCRAVCNETTKGILPELHRLYPGHESPGAFRSKYVSPLTEKVESKIAEFCPKNRFGHFYMLHKSVFADMELFWNASAWVDTPDIERDQALDEYAIRVKTKEVRARKEAEARRAEAEAAGEELPEEEEEPAEDVEPPPPAHMTPEELQAWAASAEAVAVASKQWQAAFKRFYRDEGPEAFTRVYADYEWKWPNTGQDLSLPWARDRWRDIMARICVSLTTSEDFEDALGTDYNLEYDTCLGLCDSQKFCVEDKLASLKKSKKKKKSEL